MSLKETNRLSHKYELKRIPINKINQGVRARKDFGSPKEWEQFKNNIKKRGLLHPITVMKYNAPFNGKDYFLLAGGRRTRAHIELEQTEIDAKVYPPDLSRLEIEAIELEENIQRKSMSPAEELAKVKALHELYLRIHGKKTSTSADAAGWSIRDTAELLGVSATMVSQDLRAAEILAAKPELVNRVGSKTELKRLIKHADKAVKAKKRAAEIDAKIAKTSEDMLRSRLCEGYVVKDFLTHVKTLPDETFDFINLDPDYPQERSEDSPVQFGINDALRLGEYAPLSPDEYEVFMQEALRETYRVARDKSWLIIWFGYEYFTRIQQWCAEAGWETTYVHGIWDKGRGHIRNYERYLRHRIEPFIYARKGYARIQKPHDQLFMYPATHHTKKVNPYEKPVVLMQGILETFTPVGVKVLDCCTGSGNLLLAACNHRSIAVGCDLSEEQKQKFVVRVHDGDPLKYV